MSKFLFKWFYIAPAFVAFALLIASFSFTFANRQEIVQIPQTAVKKQLPKPSFEFPQDTYNAIAESKVFSLKNSPYSLRLPDLRKMLTYLGKNGRPDGQNDTNLYFCFAGNKNSVCIKPNKPLYLAFDRTQSPPKYYFSPQNATTPLWIEAFPQGPSVQILVKMRNDKGEISTDPPEYAKFSLTETQKNSNQDWDLGPWKVNQVLLIHQKAQWYGEDLFLKTYGGDTFEDSNDKHLITFDEEAPYSIFVAVGDLLAWKDNRWVTTDDETDSIGYPILVVKKIDNNLINFELWDTEGKRKMNLNLFKLREDWDPEEISGEFKFSGARMRKQFVFEIGPKRMTLSPQDWLLRTDDGWIKINTSQQIDDFVERKLVGTLFVFDDIVKIDNGQYLKGTFFSPSRSQMEHVELALEEGKTMRPSLPPINDSEEKEEEEEEIEEDEEEEFYPPSARLIKHE